MNILFVLYQDFTANSAAQVQALANRLVGLGHDCAVAVPHNKGSVSNLTEVQFTALEFGDYEQHFPFRDRRGPDVIHAWTPREVVRKFCERARRQSGARLIVHMEDNEWHILASHLAEKASNLGRYRKAEIDELVGDAFSHPFHAVELMNTADGFTVIVDRLSELVPPGKPLLELWPSADERYFRAQPPRSACRSLFGIPRNSTVLVYTGNVHASNAREMRSLYLAVAILNREGHPATLVRAGRDFAPFLEPMEHWARRHALELGMVPHRDIPDLLALADILVQPGRPDDFNQYRFPSKLPEFLSVGRPVILPAANIALHMTHRQHGYILQQANALAIADAIREIMGDPELYRTLSDGALQFFRERLSWDRSAGKLQSFYHDVAPAPPPKRLAFSAR